MRQNRRYAVTGGIGSGKSTLLEILGGMGYPTFSCDEISRGLWREAEYRSALAALFPDCTKDGVIDKTALTERVFSDPEARKRLEGFSHPKIMERLFACTERVPVSFSEVPLLFEGGYEGEFDGAIVVTREREARLNAAARRDGVTAEKIARRADAQTEGNSYGGNVFIIENNGSAEELSSAAKEAIEFFHLK